MDELTALAPQIGQSVASAKALLLAVEKISSTLTYLNTLEVDITKFDIQLMDCKTSLDKVCTKAKAIVQILKSFLDSGHLELYPGKKKEILRKAKNHDYSALNAYLQQLKKHLKECTNCYEEFGELKEKVSAKSGDLKVESEMKKREASWGETYKRVGSFASNAASALRDGLFTKKVVDAAGPFSSTVSGFANACASLMDSAGKAVSDSGERYIEIEKNFSKISEDCYAIMKEANAMDRNMAKLMELMKVIVFKSSIVVNDEADFGTTKIAFNNLLDAIAEARKSLFPNASTAKSPCNWVCGVFGVCIFCLLAWLVYWFIYFV